jgi:CDP-diacylglycerol--glycerol-3-phosphate 3-phosphatidyltransferase
MGKSDRAFVFGAVGLLVGLGVPMAQVLNWLWGALIALLVVTIVNRVRRGCAR